MNGFNTRLSHHLREKKRPHWHIDYLLLAASLREILLIGSEKRVECAVAGALAGLFNCVPSFGASDCRCRSHLFFSEDGQHLKTTLGLVLSHLGYQPFAFQLQDVKVV
jgi:Uri superfamily endonuclease